MTAYLLIALALLQVADIATTLIVLHRGGREANPVMLWLMQRLGNAPALLLGKALLMAIMWFMPDWVLAVGCLMYAGIIINNIGVLRRV